MNDRLGEAVSALVDGEASELELRRLLANDSFGQVRTMWSRFHGLNDRSPGLDSRFTAVDISSRVMAAIDQIEQERPALWWRPVAKVAVAASVAAVVAVGMRGFGSVESQPGIATSPLAAAPAGIYPSPVASSIGNMPVSADMSPQPALRPVVLNADELARQQLDRYMLRHTERAALNSGQGIIGFARVGRLESE